MPDTTYAHCITQRPQTREKLVEAMARALMEVTALPPADTRGVELPILDTDPDYDDLPLDHAQGTSDDPITQEAVRKLAEAALAALAIRGYAVVPRMPSAGLVAGLLAHETAAAADRSLLDWLEASDLARPPQEKQR